MPNSAHNPRSLQEIGLRLVRLRVALGLNPAGMAELLDIKANKLSNWENGHNGISLAEACRISERTGATLDFIYLGIDFGLPPAINGRVRSITREMAIREQMNTKRGRPRKLPAKSDAAD